MAKDGLSGFDSNRMKVVLDMDSVVFRRPDLVATDIDEDKVFLDVPSGKYYGINRVGSAVWELADSPTSVNDICGALMMRFDIDQETCNRETLEFCQSLVDTGSFEVVAGD